MKSKNTEAIVLQEVRKVRRIILRRTRGFTHGWCRKASEMILGALRPHVGDEVKLKAGYFAVDGRSGGPHWWVEWSGMRVDVTIDQFSGNLSDGVFPAILFEPMDGPHCIHYME